MNAAPAHEKRTKRQKKAKRPATQPVPPMTVLLGRWALPADSPETALAGADVITTSGKHPGWGLDTQVTLCKPQGVALEDIALVAAAYHKATQKEGRAQQGGRTDGAKCSARPSYSLLLPLNSCFSERCVMEIEVRQVEPMRLAAARHNGPYWQIGQTFSKLGPWLEQAGVPYRKLVAVYYDDPQTTPPDELTSDAGTTVERDVVLVHEHLHVVDLEGGEYAVATYFGPYSGLPGAWRELIDQWLPSSGRKVGYGPSLEIYGRMHDVPEDQLQKIST
jgi:DNA gyrase inhibitor GyrI